MKREDLVSRPSVTEFAHKNYIFVDIPVGKYGLVKESARHAEKAVIGPARIAYSMTKTGSVNGTVCLSKAIEYFKGEIITTRELEKRFDK